MAAYEIGQNAYIKLVLHALKHPNSTVNAVLIGRLLDSGVVEISDAIPLFHSSTSIGLLPSLEIALLLIEEHCGSKGLNIVGYSHANERINDLELSNLAKNIGDHIYRYFPQSALLLLDNDKIEDVSEVKGRSHVLQLYSRDASKSWKLVETNAINLKEPSANVVLQDYIASKQWQEIIDFDDHLDDISKDWLNPELFK